jgi:heme exporter protein B
MQALRIIWAILVKDIHAEIRTRDVLSSMLVFGTLALLIFSIALDLRGALAQAAAPGILWSTIAYAGTMGLNRSLAREKRTGALAGTRMAPIDHSLIFYGKALGNLVFIGMAEAVLLPVSALLLDVPFLQPQVLLIVLLGTGGYAAAGTLLAAIAANTRAQEVMLPILLLPLTVPLLIAAVQATSGLTTGASLAEIGNWLRILVVYDLVIVAVSTITFGYTLED